MIGEKRQRKGVLSLRFGCVFTQSKLMKLLLFVKNIHVSLRFSSFFVCWHLMLKMLCTKKICTNLLPRYDFVSAMAEATHLRLCARFFKRIVSFSFGKANFFERKFLKIKGIARNRDWKSSFLKYARLFLVAWEMSDINLFLSPQTKFLLHGNLRPSSASKRIFFRET